MAVPQSFRSALNGFNREDVVHYIEYINARHNTELNQLRADMEALQSQLNAAGEAVACSEELEALRQERDELREAVAQLEEQLTAPSEKERALEAHCAELEAALQAAKAVQAQPQLNYELETYRRAERTERIARERAELVYHQTNSALAEITAKMDDAAAHVGQVADAVLAQLNALQSAVTDSKAVLKDAVSTMYTIRPHSDSE